MMRGQRTRRPQRHRHEATRSRTASSAPRAGASTRRPASSFSAPAFAPCTRPSWIVARPGSSTPCPAWSPNRSTTAGSTIRARGPHGRHRRAGRIRHRYRRAGPVQGQPLLPVAHAIAPIASTTKRTPRWRPAMGSTPPAPGLRRGAGRRGQSAGQGQANPLTRIVLSLRSRPESGDRSAELHRASRRRCRP